ncbi:MAG: hypothetical protein A2Y87_10710 [Bacteroidetes bacterium RBG_13_46_8]|nr:MAG: hypothetical protein A2Y87_10710 [Bacteroidetes bacterium RBG_13_46_8]
MAWALGIPVWACKGRIRYNIPIISSIFFMATLNLVFYYIRLSLSIVEPQTSNTEEFLTDIQK